MTTSPNGTGGAGLSLVPQVSKGASATATIDGSGSQHSDFTNVIRSALDSAEHLAGIEPGREEALAGLLGVLPAGGKMLPPTAEFAAETDVELDEADAGALFSMLGLTLIDPATAGTLPGGAVPARDVAGDGAATVLRPSISQGLAAKGGAEGAPVQAIRPGPAGADQAASQGQSPFSLVATPIAQSQAPIPTGELVAAVSAEAGGDEGEGGLRFGQTLAGVSHHTTAARPAPQAAPPLETPPGEPGWDRGIGDRILWMAGKSLQSASIQLNPRHLGPIEIQLSLQQDQASVSFQAHHAVVRDAIEAAIPRLREMFADNNLQLVNVDVGQRDPGNAAMARQFQGQHGDGGGHDGAGGGDAPGAAEVELEGTTPLSATGRGLLDDYA